MWGGLSWRFLASGAGANRTAQFQMRLAGAHRILRSLLSRALPEGMDTAVMTLSLRGGPGCAWRRRILRMLANEVAHLRINHLPPAATAKDAVVTGTLDCQVALVLGR